jgi:hypothetical protein
MVCHPIIFTTAIVIATGAIRFRWQKKAPRSRQLTAFHNCRVQKIPLVGRLMMKLTQKK